MKHQKLVNDYQALYVKVINMEKCLYDNLDNINEAAFLATHGKLSNLKNELNTIDNEVNTDVKYFYPSGDSTVSIFIATARYESGYVLIGRLELKDAIKLHSNWLWLGDNKYNQVMKNFSKKG